MVEKITNTIYMSLKILDDEGKPAEIHIDVSLLEKSKVDRALFANLNFQSRPGQRPPFESGTLVKGVKDSHSLEMREIVHSRSKSCTRIWP